MPDAKSPSSSLVLAVLLFLFLVIATLYNLAVPIGEAPDESDHIRFVEILLKTGQLPTIPKDSPLYSYEAEQPPLYYFLQAAWMRLLWPNDTLLPTLKPNPSFSAATNFSFDLRNAPNVFLHDYPPAEDLPGHLMRLLSTLFGLFTLLFVWWAARLAWPDSEGTALMAVGFVAFLPGFTFASATVTNDALATTFGAAILLGCIYLLTRDFTTGTLLLTGTAVGLGMLAKRSLIVALPLLVLVPFLASTRSRRQRFTAIAIATMVALLVGIWPLVSNMLTYSDPFATAATLAAKPELAYPLQGRPGYWLSPAYHLGLYNSLWGAFGIRSIDLPNLLYAFYYVLCFLAIVGFVRGRREIARPQWTVLLVPIALFLLINAGVDYQNTQFWAVQGRLLLPGLAALALLVGRGLSFVARDIFTSARSRVIPLLFLLLFLLAINVYALVQYILFVYYA